MDFEFQTGDRVRLTHSAIAFYGGAPPHFVPQAQGGGTDGTVIFAGERPHRPGAAPRPYYVRWDSGAENSYRVEDLRAVEAKVPDPAPEAAEEESEEAPSNIVPFRRI